MTAPQDPKTQQPPPNQNPRRHLLVPAAVLAFLALAGAVVAPNGNLTSALRLSNGIEMEPSFPPERTPRWEYETPRYLVRPPNPIGIAQGRQLFVDDFLIERTSLERVCHQAVPYEGNPVLAPGEPPDDQGYAMPFSDGVWFDPADDLFKMWYHGGRRHTLSYAYSTDGKNWVRPRLPDAVYPGTNMVLDFGGGRDSVTVWLDHEEEDPSQRFKAFSYAGSRRLEMFASPDGIAWKPFGGEINSLSDRTTVFWNPFRQVWVNSARSKTVYPTPPGEPRKMARARFYQESPDLETWRREDPAETYWTGPDTLDPAYPGENGSDPELYNLDAVAYESLLVGMFNWFYPPPGPDLVELGVGFSRDGFHWARPQRGGGPEQAFIPASGREGDWNGFNTQSAGGAFLVVGDELWFYFSGRNEPHSSQEEEAATGLATLRRDGFCSMDVAGGRGELVTRPVEFDGSFLFVNADTAGGELRAEILDSEGRPIPPFTAANSVPFRGDSTKQRLRWRQGGDLGDLAGEVVRFRFELSGGRFYSFWVAEEESGASGGYVAAGGPGFEGPVDRGDRR